MKTIIFTILFLLFSLVSFGQEIDTTLVRLKNKLTKVSTKEKKIKVLLSLGDHQLERNFNEAESYLLQAEVLINSGSVKNKKEHLASVYARLGVIQRRKGNYSDAVSFYLKAKKVYVSLQDTLMIADIVHNIGIVYRYQKENIKAIENFREAVELHEKIKNTYGVAAAYNMMGVSYRRLKELDSALIYYDKAKALFQQINKDEDVRRVYNNLATLYAVQKQYDKSIPIKLENLNYYKSVGNKMSTSVAYFNLSMDYSKTGKLQRSLKYADSSLNIALSEGYKERVSRTFLRKSIIYKQMSNYKKAYENYVSFKVYSDSIYNIESIKKIQELELKHEFDKEKSELEIQSEEQESKAKLYIFLFILALVVGGVVGYLLYRNYTARVRIVKEKLEKEKLKEELLLEKVKVSESELKSLVADNSMRLHFITDLSKKIKEDKKETGSKDIQQYTQSLILRLQQQIATESKLSSLQDRIEEINIGFNSKIMELYPSLTKTEREVCALLRLNLSIKEIASIRNGTTNSVKALRYRIRKKLEVASGVELEKFIQSL
jgi:tetratricopeptide (TPR) repeat protein